MFRLAIPLQDFDKQLLELMRKLFVQCWFTHLLVLALSFLVKRFLEHGSQATHASMRCAETLGIR